MVEYAITFARSARRELDSLDSQIGRRVLSKIDSLAHNPRPSGCVKLTGSTNLWRIRIGDWRVIYSIDDGGVVLDVVAVRHRSDAYR
jgi:mRNA interferase RelE/StbE